MRAPLEIRIHDASIGIWQDDPGDPSFRAEIFACLIRRMRAAGWSIKPDAEVKRRHPSISKDYRLGARGTMRCAIEITGRVVKAEFWSVTAAQVNRNGRRYDFDKLARMHPQDQRRFEIECRRLERWLDPLAPLTVCRTDDIRTMKPLQYIVAKYAESWHSDKKLGRPVPTSPGNSLSADGQTLEHGATVWIASAKGRIERGTAYYNINNMWWVVAGGRLRNVGSHKVYCSVPSDLRRKRNDRLRRTRLEREMAEAVQRMDFLRAHCLRQILFADQPVYLIWSRKHGAYYRSQYAGYSTDVIGAGRYTRDEAERECRRVPHILSMVTPDGTHVRFDREAA